MYVYINIYIYIYINICVCIYIYLFIHICIVFSFLITNVLFIPKKVGAVLSVGKGRHQHRRHALPATLQLKSIERDVFVVSSHRVRRIAYAR